MSDDQPPHSLDELDARLRKARERGAQQVSETDGDALPRQWLGLAFRVGIELLAAMIVGVGGGLLLDYWLGTSPWLLVLMFFLGAGAGVMNVYRAVNGMGYGPGYGREPGPGEDGRKKE
jgi:ATP synthase protein I